MRSWAALVAVSLMAAAGPVFAADPYGSGGGDGWRHGHRHHHGHHKQYRHRGGAYAEEAMEVVEYREPYLPRGILYNAPPLPLGYGYRHARGYGDVISAKY